MTQLNNTSIDYNALVAELEADLKTRDSFKALFPGETSKVFTEHGAGITALMLYHIHSAIQNGFMPTAFSKASVYALASSLGNPPTRKLGATLSLEVTVNSELLSQITLPKFSRFSGRGLEWYTTEDVIIPAGASGQTLELTVRQGERVTESFIATGKDFQRIEIGENFNVDDQFLTVIVDGVEFTNNGSTLLNAVQGDEVFAEQTSSNGRVLILFGNQVIGTIPTINVTIDISYSNTVGSRSNSSITGDSFQFLSDVDLGGGNFLQMQGVSISTASGGANEQSVEIVKATAPRLFAANQRAVRRDDYQGHIIDFTGALAAKAWGEYEEATKKGIADLTMMNRAYITAIPNSLERESNIFAVGDGITLNYSGNTGISGLIPGSVLVNTLAGFSSEVTFYSTGNTILASDQVSFNQAIGGTASASNNNAQAANAFDSNLNTSWSSTASPSVFNPLRLAYDFGALNTKVIRTIRLAASQLASQVNRGFPKQIRILASTLASPVLSNPSDWDVIRGTTLLPDPGASSFCKWIAVDDESNMTAYRHIMIEILQNHSQPITGSLSRIAEVQVQVDTNTSYIDYVTGDIDLKYQDAPDDQEDITVSGTTGNFNQTQKDDLLEYLSDLNHFTTIIEYRDPIAKLVDVVADVYYLEGENPTSVLSDVQAAIDSLFETKTDSISKPVYLSDIYQAIQDVPSVDYSLVTSPTTDIQLEINEWPVLLSKTLNIFPTTR